MEIIIFGCGKVGTTIVSSLVGEGHNIVVVDKDQHSVENVVNIYDVMAVCGNGVDCDTMLEAGVNKCDLFIAVTGSDELNMLACFLAKRLGAKHTVARMRNPEYNDDDLAFLKHHLDLSLSLTPDMLVAHEISNILKFPAATKIETFSSRNLEIVEILLKDNSPFIGTSLSELRRKHQEKFLICYVERDGDIFIPTGHFVLKEKDKIGITASYNELQKLLKKMGILQKQAKSVIILGASKIAYYLAKKLINSGMTVKIVEKDPQRCLEIAKDIPSAVVINGDGMDKEVLLEEGISSTDAYVTLTGSDEKNILSSFFAASQNVNTVVTKINRADINETAEILGLECIVSPSVTISNVISRYVRALNNSLGSNVETLYKLMEGKAEILEFTVKNDFPYLNVTLREMNIKNNVLVAGIVRGKRPIIPSGNDAIFANDKVIVIASGLQLNDLADIVSD